MGDLFAVVKVGVADVATSIHLPMGSPTVTSVHAALSNADMPRSEPAGDRNLRNSPPRTAGMYDPCALHRIVLRPAPLAKRFRNDHPSVRKYGDNCSFVDAVPKLTLAIPPYGMAVFVVVWEE